MLWAGGWAGRHVQAAVTPGPWHASPSALLRPLPSALAAAAGAGPGAGAGSARRQLRYLPGASCHLVAIPVIRKQFFFPLPTCNLAIAFLEMCAFCHHPTPTPHPPGARKGERASLSAACAERGLALQSGKFLAWLLSVDFAGGEGWESLKTGWDLSPAGRRQKATLPRRSAAAGFSPLACNDSGP